MPESFEVKEGLITKIKDSLGQVSQIKQMIPSIYIFGILYHHRSYI
jgi:hypothetical protein